MITAVDLVRGLGKYAGLEVIDVPGATGYLDTNYEGKADAAIKALERKDLVIIHVEAADEAGHEGDAEKKIQAIEDIDKRVIGRLLENLKGDFRIAVCADHPTPIKLRTHTAEPPPFAVYEKGKKGDSVGRFSERKMPEGEYGIVSATEFMGIFLG